MRTLRLSRIPVLRHRINGSGMVDAAWQQVRDRSGLAKDVVVLDNEHRLWHYGDANGDGEEIVETCWDQ